MDCGIGEPALAFRVFTLLGLGLESIRLIKRFLDRRPNCTQVRLKLFGGGSLLRFEFVHAEGECDSGLLLRAMYVAMGE